MDFDGDTCALQLVPEEAAQDTYEKMSPRFVNVYKKNNQPIYPFNLETLNGLNVATEITPDDPKDLEEPRYFYDDYAKLLKDVEVDKKIKIGTPIVFTGKVGGVDYKTKKTTYGRLRISKILETDLDNTKILDNPMEPIKAKAAGKLSAWMNGDPKGVEKRLALQKFALRAVTIAGVVTFDYKTLFVDTNTDLYKEICKVADSKELTDPQKIAILTEKYADYEKEIEGKFSQDLKNELERAGKIKLSSISALNMPQLIISGVDEVPIITRGSLLQGYSEKDMIYHSVENRSLQSIKQSGTPTSGYLTRQISFIMNSFVYHEGEDNENPGILIPRYKAGGRTAPDGTVYPEKPSKKEDENDLVPVRSIISKKSGDLSTVTPDLIGKKFKDLTDGTAIGVSFATSLTEGSTQSALGLKHGGHERVLDRSFYLKAPDSCTMREEGNWLYLKTGKKKELKYPRPTNFVNVGKTEFEKGESVGVAYQTVSPIAQVNTLIDFIGARRSAGLRYYEKEMVIVSDCYAYEDGVINYVEENGVIVDVRIGNHSYQYNPKCIYYYPEGAQVKKFDRICSGVANMAHVISEVGEKNLTDIYLIFRKQFLTISDKSFQKTGISPLSGTQEELIELLFRGITLIEYDPKTLEIEKVEYRGSQKSIINKNSFFTVLSYGYGGQVVNKAMKGEIELTGDVMAETVLGLLLNNKLDEK